MFKVYSICKKSKKWGSWARIFTFKQEKLRNQEGSKKKYKQKI